MNQFSAERDYSGNLIVGAGVVTQPRNSTAIIVNGASSNSAIPGEAGRLVLPPPVGQVFIGGSGRNIIITGLAALNGYYQPQRPTKWGTGSNVFTVTGASAATLHDGTNTVAILSTGGTAPVGNYVATSYGQTTYNGGAAFTLVATAEEGWPGVIPSVQITVPSPMQGGVYTPTDSVNYVSAVDSDWTLIVNVDGSAYLKHQGNTVATRPTGSNYSADGYYSSPSSSGSNGYYYRAGEFPEFTGPTAIPPFNGFGTLVLTFNWTTYNNLETGTTFLGQTVGAGYGSSPYMTWSAANTNAGPEYVIIDLAAAFSAGLINDYADISIASDWNISAGGKGAAILNSSYGGNEQFPMILPGHSNPSTTPVIKLRVYADGVNYEFFPATWGASASTIPGPTRAGTVFLTITETAGVLTSVTGPFLQTTPAAPSAGSFNFVLAISDGATITQTHVGPVVWDTHNATFATPVILPAYTVATLPASPALGATAMVTDATLGLAAGLGLAPVGGGANKTPVYSDGAGWKIG